MNTITVFETYQDLGTRLGELHQQNTVVREELSQRRNQAETEFRARYHVNERIQAALQKQEEAQIQKHPDWFDETSPSSSITLLSRAPTLVGLSKEEQQQFNIEYSDYGKGLALSISIGLLGIGSQYLVQAGSVVRPGDAWVVGKNQRSIKGLAKVTRDYLQQEHYPTHGALITPLIYTVTEVVPLVTEEHKAVLRQNLEEDSQSPPNEGKKAKEMRLMLARSLEAMVKEKRSFRGLDERERENFMRWYQE